MESFTESWKWRRGAFCKGFPGVSVVKNPPADAGDVRDVGSILGSGRSPGEGSGNLLQYSFLKNSMDRGAWRATVLGITSQTRLSDWARRHSDEHRGLMPLVHTVSATCSLWEGVLGQELCMFRREDWLWHLCFFECFQGCDWCVVVALLIAYVHYKSTWTLIR